MEEFGIAAHFNVLWSKNKKYPQQVYLLLPWNESKK